MNKIVNSEDINKDLYETLTGDFDTVIYDEHRRGSTFFMQVVQEITEDICKEYNLPEYYIGLWKSNVFVWSDEDCDRDEMFPFTKVTKETKEVTVTETYYKEIEDEFTK